MIENVIKFNFDDVDWAKYKYPGFKIGDLLKEKATGYITRCYDISTAKKLEFENSFIPDNYIFINVHTRNNSQIWTHPEYYELYSNHLSQEILENVRREQPIKPPAVELANEPNMQHIMDDPNFNRLEQNLRNLEVIWRQQKQLNLDDDIFL